MAQRGAKKEEERIKVVINKWGHFAIGKRYPGGGGKKETTWCGKKLKKGGGPRSTANCRGENAAKRKTKEERGSILQQQKKKEKQKEMQGKGDTSLTHHREQKLFRRGQLKFFEPRKRGVLERVKKEQKKEGPMNLWEKGS